MRALLSANLVINGSAAIIAAKNMHFLMSTPAFRASGILNYSAATGCIMFMYFLYMCITVLSYWRNKE